jgi:hypothetical protein
MGASWVVPALGGHIDARPETSFEFLKLSRLLTGRQNLSADTADRLFLALSAAEPGFRRRVAELLEFSRSGGNSTIEALTPALDKDAPELAALANAVVRAWYTGIVGTGPAARVIEDSGSLMFAVVADALTPPSYCAAADFDWTAPPPAP